MMTSRSSKMEWIFSHDDLVLDSTDPIRQLTRDLKLSTDQEVV
jgi:hypothetical protein